VERKGREGRKDPADRDVHSRTERSRSREAAAIGDAGSTSRPVRRCLATHRVFRHNPAATDHVRTLEAVMKSIAIRSILGAALVLIASWAVQTQDRQEPAGERPNTPATLILDRAETIEFTTDEGTWMSLDVSPDGKTIVFDLLGDLYTLPIDGGTATRIIGGMSFESQPKFSPDGKTIAFLTDRSGVENLWVANADGSNPRAVTKDRPTQDRPEMMLSPAWTADGEYLLVSKSRPPETTFGVFLYDKDGGTGIRIGSAPPPQPPPGADAPPARPAPNRMGAVASPDGRFIYYAERMGSFTYNARFPLWQIVRFDRDTGDTSTITNAQGSAMRPVLSPDGKSLVFATRFETKTGLRIRNLETGDERWLIHPVTRDDQESRASRDTMPGYGFTPDGQSLVVPIDGHIQRVDVATGRSRSIPFSARVQAEIAPRLLFENRVDDGPTVRAKLVRWPNISPDGRRVVFSALNHVWIMDVPGGKPERLTSLAQGEFMPAWSPDGRSIAFVTWSNEGGHLYRVAATPGSQPEQLSRHAAYYAEPVYTPDGSRIVYLTGTRADQLYADLRYIQAGHSDVEQDDAPTEISGIRETADMDLRWMPASGGESTLIGSAHGGASPHFANDSVHIYLTGRRGLTSVRIDGFDRRQLVEITGAGAGQNPPAASEIRVSPDGRRAFVSLQNKHVILGLPRAGKEAVKISIKGRDDSVLPVKRLSREGGDYLSWSADGKAVIWSLGSTIYRQALGADTPESITPVVEAPRARPRGSIVLTGARIVTMKADEVIEKGDVVVTDNRVVSVGPTGRVERPTGAKVVDAAGKTIIPGFVDVHAHMWPPHGVHQTQVWQYLANLAYGATTTRDPQTSTNDVFAYADLVETGDIIGPRVLATGPGVFSSSDRRQGRGGCIRQALQGGVPDRHDQAVRGRRPDRPPVDHPGGEAISADADDGRRARPEARSLTDDRRLHRVGAQPADPAAVQGRDAVRREDAHLLHADDARGVWRALVGELLLRDHRAAARRSEDAAVHSPRAVRHDGTPPGAVVPARGVRTRRHREGRGRRGARGRPRRPRQSWSVSGTGRALGDLESAIGRSHAA
jgi:Tol biopolymer transport system component